MIRNTTTPQAAPADIHEATAPLSNAGAILETLARSFSTAEPELSATLQVVLHELYAGMERCEQLDMDTRKAQAAAATPATSTAAPAPADTQPATAASVAADVIEKINRLPAKQRDAVIGVMQSLDRKQSPDDDTTATDQDEEDAAVLADLDARRRSNQYFTDNTSDTLDRVKGGLALLSRIDDSEDVDEDANFGKMYLFDSLRCALELEIDRVDAARRQKASA